MTELVLEQQQPFHYPTLERFQDVYDRLDERARQILGVKEKTNDDRAYLLQQLRTVDSTLNGQAEVVASDLELFHAEAEKKKEWNTWDFVKETGKKTWEVAKKYKWWLVGAAAVGLTAYGFYSGAIPTAYNAVKTWLGTQAWLGSISDKVSGFFTKTIPNIVPTAPSIPAMPEVPGFPSVPVAPSIPTPPIPSGPAPDVSGLGNIWNNL